ncbi:MAG: GNAT family N-acetyltransferase [Albidovulum sp.]|uniref:GNAT family N-acetyltransferase n=1 Tax=Albidovulum sp. TaxID=1872424 RepID=UPI003CBD57B1
MIIRRVGPDEAAAWRAIRLEALATVPEAFSARLADWQDRPLADFAAQLAANPTFLAFDGDAPVGCIAWIRDAEDAARGWIGGVFVAGAARGSGLGHAMIGAAMADAQGAGVTKLWLDVGAGNLAAQSAYRRAGFAEVAAEERPGTACSACEISMWRALP